MGSLGGYECGKAIGKVPENNTGKVEPTDMIVDDFVGPVQYRIQSKEEG